MVYALRLALLCLALLKVFSTEESYIVVFGQTRKGKSKIGNDLLAPGQAKFLEGEGDDAVTKLIAVGTAWNNVDKVADVPGYLDRDESADKTQQAAFVDFIKGKNVRAILFIYTDGIDSFTERALKSFESSDLKNNIIVVRNKLINPPASEVESINGFPKVNVRVGQTNYDVLKSKIAEMTPVLVRNLVVPVTLFKTPLVVTGTSEVEVLAENKLLPVKDTIYTIKDVLVPSMCKRKTKVFGVFNGDPEHYPCERKETLTTKQDVFVDKLHEIVNRFTLTFAERFDGVTDIYKKDFKETVTRLVA